MYRNIIKPFLDFVSALMALIVASPVLLIFGILLIINNRGSLFFTQLRPGKDAKLFKVYKFKTMTDQKDASGNLLSDEKRLTPIGKFVRATSMDELPQILNVLKGDISFVGPRPLLPSYLELYTKRQATRHEVKPGITGWTQVNGRNAIPWEQKFEYDAWYVENQSFLLDFKIVLMTFKKVFQSDGISDADSSTMVSFTGTKDEPENGSKQTNNATV
ncbi:Sugar transferase involved in LPS biosynthesis (colanic, teichoic acid) [Nonlabens sp. Hel1_33_55]|uniref:sugar transferase n=1 Tax=Nonlabens sp. Hel1_33_55 TaxID=1336802 RepID=UPI000875E3DF|nr:sugar transferase [Nonlabens sp. Hel1_33_55]SCX94588.1 Sugar transferase involved in LPS biosynthesis (colanic, teichoic acid) [Nonlabens sp. Hel1_33_55]